jgi:murein DD-endopeptidase MepM/ murein hydrolase activator NlpD
MLRTFVMFLRAGGEPGGCFVLPLSARHRTAAACLLAAALLVVHVGSAAAQDGGHTVREGETLSDIAARNHTTVRALAEANGIGNANRITIGQVLVIPSGGGAAAAVVHVVAPGETLSGIASRYGTSSRALASANGISDPNLVRIGARLTVPAGSGSGGGGAAGSHTVASGDTLGGIASRFGTSIGAIVSANSLSDPNLIRIGQRLVIPAGGSGGGGGSAAASAGAGGYAATGGSDGRTGVSGTHTVASGESLTSIARRYGVPTDALAAANGIPRPWNLYAGARLFLSAPNRLPGDLARCPVPGASFVNDWGFPRSGGRAHAGTDLFAPRGTPVLAPASGTVSFAVGTIGGRQFRLQGDDGTLYLGSHMDRFGTSGRVQAGTTIGYVGDSGNAAGGRPHLHFEVHPDGGSAMNPFPLVRIAC